MLDADALHLEIKTFVRQRQTELSPASKQAASGSGRSRHNPADELSLQRIQIERFPGDSTKWPNFKCKFEQFFHNNDSISDGTKYIRLDALIEKDTEPYNRIKGITRDPENYRSAWDLLCRTYANKRKLVDDMINSFIDLPPMRTATRDELMVVVNEVNNLTGSLARYDEVGVQHWDAILVNLVLRKIDENAIFLENRAQSMRNAPPPARKYDRQR